MICSLGFFCFSFEGGGSFALKFGSLGFIQDPLIVYGRGFVQIEKKQKQNIFCIALQLTVVVKDESVFGCRDIFWNGEGEQIQCSD